MLLRLLLLLLVAADSLALAIALSVAISTPFALALAFAPSVTIACSDRVCSSKNCPGCPLLCQCRREDLRWQVQNFAQILNAFICEEIVVPLPVELLRKVCAGSKGLANHHPMQVGMSSSS